MFASKAKAREFAVDVLTIMFGFDKGLWPIQVAEHDKYQFVFSGPGGKYSILPFDVEIGTFIVARVHGDDSCELFISTESPVYNNDIDSMESMKYAALIAAACACNINTANKVLFAEKISA